MTLLDESAAIEAFRTRAQTLSVCAPGPQSLSATSTGYARAAGSFVTEGFKVGMEITTASGFSQSANNTPCVITAVTALALTILGGRTVESAGSGKTLAVGFPALRSWNNERLARIAGRH